MCWRSDEGIFVNRPDCGYALLPFCLPYCLPAKPETQPLTQTMLANYGLPVWALLERWVIISSGSEQRFTPMTHSVWTCQIPSAALTSALTLDPTLPDNITQRRCLKHADEVENVTNLGSIIRLISFHSQSWGHFQAVGVSCLCTLVEEVWGNCPHSKKVLSSWSGRLGTNAIRDTENLTGMNHPPSHSLL